MYMSQIGLVEPWSEPHGGIIVFWEWYWCKEGECWFTFIESLKLGNCNDTSLEPRDDDSWFYNCTTKFEGMVSLKSTYWYSWKVSLKLGARNCVPDWCQEMMIVDPWKVFSPLQRIVYQIGAKRGNRWREAIHWAQSVSRQPSARQNWQKEKQAVIQNTKN